MQLDQCKATHASGKLQHPFVAGMANADLFTVLKAVCYRIFELSQTDQGGTH